MSSFRGESQPRNMRARASGGVDRIQTLDYQKDTVGFYHGQDCGKYTVSIEPELPFIKLSSSGVPGPRNYPFTDTITISGHTLEHIGSYNLVMKIEQVIENGDGYRAEYFSTMPSITYNFVVNIDPCRIIAIIDDAPDPLTYVIGDPTRTAGFYNF